nr:hypothetical protein [Marinicella sp. W31]MDC2876419.1 hypothetical protein [Marinicella sp. W31]
MDQDAAGAPAPKRNRSWKQDQTARMSISSTAQNEQTPARPTIEENFRRASRHSGHVRRLKILLPLAAVLITLGLIAATFLRSIVPDNITLDAASIEDGMIVMTNPGMSGRNSDGIRYSLKAERALLPATNPEDTTVLLENVVASVPVDESVTAVVNATRTLYDRVTERLSIDEPFTITMSNGMTADFTSAQIDIKAGTLTSDHPVSVNSPRLQWLLKM